MIAYKLFMTSPLHLSTGGDSYEKTFHYLHSDTLFSALLASWHYLYDDDPEVLVKNFSFKISSAFPFYGQDFYFPKPLCSLPLTFDSQDAKARKKLGKVTFVEKTLFEKMIAGDTVNTRDICFSPGGALLGLKKDIADFFSEVEIARNVIDRISGKTDIFYFSELHFRENSGLYFLADFADETTRKKFTAVLRFLGDEGIGGDRHVGKGLFDLQVSESFTLNQPTDGDSLLNLSLYHPTRQEIDSRLLDRSAYEIINRKGWITAPGHANLRKRSLNMFLEGSVFSDIEEQDYGDIQLVAEKGPLLPFNVFRYGKGFMVKCRYTDGETHAEDRI